MKKIILLLLSLTFIQSISFPQNPHKHDSLLDVLKHYDNNKIEMQLPLIEKRDTVKADLLWELYSPW